MSTSDSASRAATHAKKPSDGTDSGIRKPRSHRKSKREKKQASPTPDNFIQVESSLKYNYPGKNQPVIDYKHITVYDMWKNSVKNYSEKDCFGFRTKLAVPIKKGKHIFTYSDYQWISYGEAGAIIDRIGSALAAKLKVRVNENIGIYMKNSPQWLMSDFAIHRQGCVSVPLFSTFGTEQLEFISNQCDIRIMFCDSNVASILFKIVNHLPNLRIIIVVDKYALTDEETKIVKSHSLKLIFWDQLEAAGVKSPQPEVPTKAKDIFSIIYTSGTTGDPKGAMLTNRNALAATEVIHNSPHFPNGLYNEVHYSYLPLAHVYERDLSLNVIRSGSKIGFSSGPIENLLDDVKNLKPTFIIGVPRVFKWMYDKVVDAVGKMGFLTRNIYSIAIDSKLGAKEKGKSTWINWDSIVFKKFKAMVGGRCRTFLSAAAPIDTAMLPWLECAFMVNSAQAYGLTETFAGVTVSNKISNSPLSSIGVVCDLCTIRLVDVPDMKYFHTDNPPRGEIQVKGETVFAGYYKNKELTDEVLTSDGWFATGDIAQLDTNGESFTIIDRKKNMFKLAQGEYIAAERLENIYGRSPGIAQIWVYGESGDSFIVAVVVPDVEMFPRIAKNLGISGDIMSEPEKLNSPAAYKYFMDILAETGTTAQLAGFEMVKGILIEPELFTIESHLLTPSYKLIRSNLKMKYQEQLTVLRKKVSKQLNESTVKK